MTWFLFVISLDKKKIFQNIFIDPFYNLCVVAP